MPNIIEHLAIIMDGNGRWAQRQGLPRMRGHRAGADTVRNTVKLVKKRGITHLTLYAFSSENWRRPSEEVNGLFRLLSHFIDEELESFATSGVRLHIIGDLAPLDPQLQDKIRMSMERTQNNSELHLVIALNYGGRDELIRATRKLLATHAAPEEITEETLSACLDTAAFPDPDLLIRTGGEQRTSNFLPWQLAYTELYFSDILWPDFDEQALDQALSWFSSRERRFGMISEQLNDKEHT